MSTNRGGHRDNVNVQGCKGAGIIIRPSHRITEGSIAHITPRTSPWVHRTSTRFLDDGAFSKPAGVTQSLDIGIVKLHRDRVNVTMTMILGFNIEVVKIGFKWNFWVPFVLSVRVGEYL